MLIRSMQETIARQRGITEGEESLLDVAERVSRSVVEVDACLEGRRDPSFADELTAMFSEGTAMPGTPILTNAGRSKATVAACTVVKVPPNGTCEALWQRSTVELAAGLGVGYDLSETSDPVSQAIRLNDWLRGVDQDLVRRRRRPVASMVTLNARHPDILRFIHAKEGADFSQWRANLSVVFNGEDADRIFDSLVVPIAEAAHRCGEPGVLFFNRFEMDNPTPQISYESTAPCAEVALAAGEQCHFWYVNAEAMVVNTADGPKVDWERLRQTVGLSVRALDTAVQMSIDSGAAPIVGAKRRIGVGITGFHGLLMRLGISYASAEAEALAREVSERITYFAHSASADLAARRGPFPLWQTSRFRDKEWLNRKSVSRTGAVGTDDWRKLHDRIAETGIRHASVVAYPPAGVTSELLRTSKSYEPYFTLTGLSQPDQLTKRECREIPPSVEQAIHRLNPDEAVKLRRKLMESESGGMIDVPESHLLATARQISADWHLRIHAAFQSFADESGAKTVNVAEDVDLSEMIDLFQSARRLGLKGISVFRDNCLNCRTLRPTIGVK